MTTLQIFNQSKSTPAIKATLASSFFSKFLGLMFKKTIPQNTGLLLAETSESKLNTSIHMLFMNFDICTVWIDKTYKVVDVKYAKKWHLAYFPQTAAQYVLETNPQNMNYFSIGDQLQFVYEK